MRARWASARIWASSGACPSAAAAAARSARPPGGAAGGQLRLGVAPPRVPSAVRAAQALPGFGGRAPCRRVASPASRVRSASQVARSAGIVATNGWSVNGAPPIWSTHAARASAAANGERWRPGRRGARGPARPGRRRRACPPPAAARTGSSGPASEQGERPLDLPEGVAGPACPQGELRGLLRRFSRRIRCFRLADDGVSCWRRRAAASRSPRSRSISARQSCAVRWSPSGGPVVSGSISAAASPVRP